MKDSILSILACISENDAEEISPEHSIIKDLRFSSLDIMSMALAIESEFGISIPDKDYGSFLRVSDLINYIEERLRAC